MDKQLTCFLFFPDLNGNKANSFFFEGKIYKDLTAESKTISGNKRNENLFLYGTEGKSRFKDESKF